MLELVPITLKEANAFVERYHRHHKPVVGHKFSIAASDGEKIVGVAIVGRPVSRYLDNGLTLEVNRLCTDGTRYGAQRKSRKSRKVKRIMKRQTVKKLIQCVAIIAAGVLAIILFMLAIWCRGKNSEPVTDEQVAAQMQQAEPLVIETPEAATEGSIRVYDYDGCCIYAYYGKIRINNDGKDGKDIDVEALGYLEGYQEHKDESEAGE